MEAPPAEKENESAIWDHEDGQVARSQANPAGRRPSLKRIGSISSKDVAESETSTRRWVRQQQRVDVAEMREKSLLQVATRGSVAQRRLFDSPPSSSNIDDHSASQNQDLASLTTDVDESIEQLNKLIMDLDPTFVPVETSCSPLSRSASERSSYLSRKGNNHLSGSTNTHTQIKYRY